MVVWLHHSGESEMQKHTIAEKIIRVLQLAAVCPMGEALQNCPAKQLRTTPVQDRLRLVEGLGESILDEVIAHHKACFDQRSEPEE